MTGLIYKELWQNRKTLWLCALAAPCCFLLFLLMGLLPAAAGQSTIQELFGDLMGKGDETSLPIATVYCIIMPFFMAGIAALGIFGQDETKKWGYFTASHPKGVQGAMYAKYVLIFLMSVITMVSVTLTDELLMLTDHLILGTPREEIVSYSMFAMIFVFVQLFLRMFDIPFIIRFGKKRGESVKVLMVGGLFVGAFLYALFGPLPGDDTEFLVNFVDKLYAFMQGEGPDISYYLLAGLCWVTIIGYYVSYRISCKLYMKGVEQYDK